MFLFKAKPKPSVDVTALTEGVGQLYYDVIKVIYDGILADYEYVEIGRVLPYEDAVKHSSLGKSLAYETDELANLQVPIRRRQFVPTLVA